MIFFNAFLDSLKLPSKRAVFQLNRIGMDITVIYMFIIMAIVAIPALLDRLTGTSGPGADMAVFFQLIYFFMFYYLPLTIIVFVVLSGIAYIFTWIAKILKRKLRFQLLWKMGAYTTTIPFLLYAVIALLFTVDDSMMWLFFIYSICILLKIVTVYPRRKKRT
ncbi:hypothetical protein CFK37_06275 [Virgibacillus phasianinus]|uniref:DUF1189 domain-containing protein n=1 Tax=Virgibacillus phasianinus TaxID=2017483 RepID=A0A220U132_9BACI|nr:DUF1189 family protein [Virgibacillus phasianinus]ASK61789.1 hypothetical protein CFK37_06275 [Virgibacillus phasianinus]